MVTKSHDIGHDVSRLSAAYPIALLPVRLETRFVGSALKIRVYPDAIFADGHRAGLTKVEIHDGEVYWKAGWDPAAELDAWRALVKRYPAERAAWIVAQTLPPNIAARPVAGGTGPEPSPPAIDAPVADVLPRYVARCLPSAWLAIGYRGGFEVARAVGAPIRAPLHLTFAGAAGGGGPLEQRDELAIERDLLWTVDFEAAQECGMALTMSLHGLDVQSGLDRLIVVGIRTVATGVEGANELAALLDAHHYTRGLAFVAQGTPTNNTALGPAGYPPPDDPARSFEVERQPQGHAPGSDGQALAEALGLPMAPRLPYELPQHPSRPLDRIEGTNRTEGARAAAMNAALWPSTLGYHLDQMMVPQLPREHLPMVRAHFCGFVRGRGPLAALRVGRVPYGILPATSLRRWQAAPSTSMSTGRIRPDPGAPTTYVFDANVQPDPIDTTLVGLLEVWRQRFLERAAGLVRVGASANADADLLAVLIRDASSRELRVREVLGPALVDNVMRLGPKDAGRETLLRIERARRVSEAMEAAGLTGPPPWIASMTLADAAPRVSRPWVTLHPSETATLTPNYIRLLRAPLWEIRRLGKVLGPAAGYPILFHLLRQSILVECARVGLDLAIARGVARPSDRNERELHGITPGSNQRRTTWDILSTPVAGLTGQNTLGDWMTDPGTNSPNLSSVHALQATFATLEDVPTAELERLVTETLDTCSHRLDAWITSIATRRLRNLRASHPVGIHLGGYGWLEDLRPRTTSASAGGFIHAPSPTHAATAAILRNAHLTRTGEARRQAAVDMSSERVHGALELLDGVRQGLPLGAVLGFHLERSLHDASLDTYIYKYRAKYPLARDPSTVGEPGGDLVAARNVVDGLAIAAVYRENPDWKALLEVAGHEADLQRCFEALEQSIDALADVLLAESVHQALQGKTERAAATMSSLAGGGAIPVPEVVATPHVGTSVTHRVVISLDDSPLLPPWRVTPRHLAEPRVGVWLAQQLGDPSRARVRASYPDPTGDDPDRRATVVLSLAQLRLSPLDVLAIAAATTPEGDGELDARLRQAMLTGLDVHRAVTFDHQRDPGAPADQLTLLEVLDVARLLAAVIGGARPLSAADLAPPGDVAPAAQADDVTVLERLQLATIGLDGAADRLETTLAALTAQSTPHAARAVREALWLAAGYGIRAAVPMSFDDEDAAQRAALAGQATSALGHLARRASEVAQAGGPADRLRAVFGSSFPIVPTCAPNNLSVLTEAISRGPSLVGHRTNLWRWFEGVARVRPPLAALRLATMATEAIGAPRLEPHVAQLPDGEGRPWIASSFNPDVPEARPRAGTVAITFDRTPTSLVGGRVAGLKLDEWTERIPARALDTAFAVHHDTPGAEAPQCVLLAVPPMTGPSWDLDSLLAVIHETLDLARVRSVDGDELGVLGMFAPMTVVACNLADQAVSTDAFSQTIADPTLGEE